ncbi:MAG: hypothetical protein IKG77_03195 [Prevotella sp.]|nr:hypothetical protein [Prevotella sp.]
MKQVKISILFILFMIMGLQCVMAQSFALNLKDHIKSLREKMTYSSTFEEKSSLERQITMLEKYNAEKGEDIDKLPLSEQAEIIKLLSEKAEQNASKDTLISTTTINGIKCEHFIKDGKYLRTLKKGNGDYITYKEDPNGLDKAPDEDNKEANDAIGSFRYTHSDGMVLVRENDSLTVKLKNGNLLKMVNINIPWEEFINPLGFYDYYDDFYKRKIVKVYLTDQPNMGYSCNNGIFSKDGKEYKIESDGKISVYDIITELKQLVIKEKLTQAAFSISKAYANGTSYLGYNVFISQPDYDKTKAFSDCFFGQNNDSALVWLQRSVDFGGLSQNYYKGAKYQIQKYGRIKDYESGKKLMDYKDERSKAEKLMAKYKQKYGVNYYNQLCVNGQIVKGMSYAMIQEYAKDLNSLNKIARYFNQESKITYSIKQYEPTVRDMTQHGRAVKVYRFYGNNGLGASFKCVNGKVVSVSTNDTEHFTLADHMLYEIEQLEKELQNE